MNLKMLERLWNQVQKPAQYTGGELGSIVKNKENIAVRYALCFPDLYEIGMSHLGSKILYSLQNKEADVWCERVYAPAPDMETLMRKQGVSLYGLESLESITNFDFIGFTLQYEMSYTAILNMLDLAGLPIRAAERETLAPIVMAGGPCACNPEPLADFIDLFVLGEGEEINLEVIDLYRTAKQEGWSKKQYLKAASHIQGVYVPSLYQVTYLENGHISEISPLEEAPIPVRKRIIQDLDKVFFPEQFVVPYIRVVHDRTMLEVLRGCLHGCRFCQAGFIYRPYREKLAKTLAENAEVLTKNTGYEEISLTSLSTSDHTQLNDLLEEILPWTTAQNIGISLPSLRINSVSPELLEQISSVRKSGLTFAPEAGTQRLRDVINKNVTEEGVLETCKKAFLEGYSSVKLYFMMGLPTETMEDIAGIADLAQKVVELFYSLPERKKGRSVNVTISAACFVPKPFTPFEFEPQDSMETFYEKQRYLKSCLKTKKISFRYHDSPISVLEAVLARGDRKLSDVIYRAWQKGSRLDGWSEHFHLEHWTQAIEDAGIDPTLYANRTRDYEEIMPWDHLDYGVSKNYLIGENKKAHLAETTVNCREKCLGCGAATLYPEGERRLPCK